MLSIASNLSKTDQEKYIGQAKVLKTDGNEGLILLEIEKNNTTKKIWAKSALAYQAQIFPGESVLAVGDEENGMYITGLLDLEKPETKDTKPLFKMKNGIYGLIDQKDKDHTFKLMSNSGELMFAYDSKTKKSIVNIHSGDLDFVTHQGKINFKSAEDINFTSEQSVNIKSLFGINLGITDNSGNTVSTIKMNIGKMKFTTPDFSLITRKGNLIIRDLKYKGKKISTTVDSVLLIAKRTETIAKQVFEKAKTVYKQIEGLRDIKAGRLKTLVKTTLHVKSKKAYHKAEKVYKINADKINLG